MISKNKKRVFVTVDNVLLQKYRSRNCDKTLSEIFQIGLETYLRINTGIPLHEIEDIDVNGMYLKNGTYIPRD